MEFTGLPEGASAREASMLKSVRPLVNLTDLF